MTRYLLSAALPMFLIGCGSGDADNAAPNAMAADNAVVANDVTAGATTGSAAGAQTSLAAADGAARGTATITEGPDGLMVQVAAEGLTPGEHGLHVHMVGLCEAPKFESAGAHWNPTDKQHGRDNPQGAHSGDMPNLTAGADGRASGSFTLPGETLARLLDADGAALVVHATADDYRTDPSGNSGDRIACGVISRP